MHYVGTLHGGPRNGEQFDSSRKPGCAISPDASSCVESNRCIYEQWEGIQNQDRSWKCYQGLGWRCAKWFTTLDLNWSHNSIRRTQDVPRRKGGPHHHSRLCMFLSQSSIPSRNLWWCLLVGLRSTGIPTCHSWELWPQVRGRVAQD